MKGIGIVLVILASLGVITWIGFGVYANYQWSNTTESNWNLADKASTIQVKADYIDKFVAALKNGNLADNNALIWKTADNNCQNNINAVSTLKQRLDEIKTMDVSSFQYQQAISQITEQEQGQSEKLTGTLSGCWFKTNHYFLWNQILALLYFVLITLGFIVGGILIAQDD